MATVQDLEIVIEGAVGARFPRGGRLPGHVRTELARLSAALAPVPESARLQQVVGRLLTALEQGDADWRDLLGCYITYYHPDVSRIELLPGGEEVRVSRE